MERVVTQVNLLLGIGYYPYNDDVMMNKALFCCIYLIYTCTESKCYQVR